MIKAYSRRKLQRTQSGRMMLLRNLTESLILSEKIVTTLPKAKELKRFFDKIMTSAKLGGITGFRRVNVHIKDKQVSKKIFEILVFPKTGNNHKTEVEDTINNIKF